MSFRIAGRVPQLWDAATGEVSEVRGWREIGGRTDVPLALEANASVFVVFRAREHGVSSSFAPTNLIADLPVRLRLDGPWEVNFAPGWGAPDRIQLPKLMSWTEHENVGVRHYSGAAVYMKEFEMPELRRGERVMLDLGEVQVLASVKLNDRGMGVLWKPPYAVDVADALKPGHNRLEVRVVNVWVNRLIADAALPPEQRLTWASWNPFRPGDALLPSGLLGPVQLRSAAE